MALRIALAAMSMSPLIQAFSPICSLRFPYRHRHIITGRVPPCMLFMDEVKLRDDALQWAKEKSRLDRLPGVIALYDTDMRCSFVGVVDDASFATAALVKKHGVNVCCKLRVEEFPKETPDDDMGVTMMNSLAKSWLSQATDHNGGAVPVGNVEEGWCNYDRNKDPYLAGVFGANGMMLEDSDNIVVQDIDSPDEKTQQRKERMKVQLDEAMARSDERAALEFMRRLNALSDDDSVDGTYTE